MVKKMSVGWNLWHGCQKISPGCQNCYVYRMDAKFEKDSAQVKKNSCFDLPVQKNRKGEYKIPPGETVYTCFTSDFLLPDADEWRIQAWEMMKERSDLRFLFLTKRIDRLEKVLPPDWGAGYENGAIGCTVENQDRADYRLPIFMSLPIRHRLITCEPLLGKLDLSPYLGPKIESVLAGGESGPLARVCDYAWVLDIRQQCIDAKVRFHFKQTGAKLLKDGKLYRVPRKLQHSQARKANINYQ